MLHFLIRGSERSRKMDFHYRGLPCWSGRTGESRHLLGGKKTMTIHLRTVEGCSCEGGGRIPSVSVEMVARLEDDAASVSHPVSISFLPRFALVSNGANGGGPIGPEAQGLLTLLCIYSFSGGVCARSTFGMTIGNHRRPVGTRQKTPARQKHHCFKVM